MDDLGILQLKCTRGSYLKIFEPDDNDGKWSPRYTGNFLFPKDTDEGKAMYKDVQRHMVAAAKARHKDKMPVFAKDKKCLRDGDDEELVKDRDREVYAGQWYISAARAQSQGRPTIVDRDRTPLSQADGKPISGDYVNVFIRVYIPKDYPNQIAASLEGIQFFKKGDPLAAAPMAVSQFEDFSDNDDAEGLGSSAAARQANGRDASASLEI
jgi:hypothetical protein